MTEVKSHEHKDQLVQQQNEIILIPIATSVQAVKINPFRLSFYTCSITTIVYKLGNQVSNSKAVYILLALFKVFHRMSTKNKIKHNNYTQYTDLHNSPSFYCTSLKNLISHTWFRLNNPPSWTTGTAVLKFNVDEKTFIFHCIWCAQEKGKITCCIQLLAIS